MTRTRTDNYFGDFKEGQVYEHPRGRTITETHMLMTNMVLNTSEGHFNSDLMEDSEFGAPIVYGGINLAIVSGLASETISENALSITSVDDVRFLNPVYHGDVLYAESEVLERTDASDHSDAGEVTFGLRGYNQDGDQVLEAKQTVLLKKETHPVA